MWSANKVEVEYILQKKDKKKAVLDGSVLGYTLDYGKTSQNLALFYNITKISKSNVIY